MKNKIFVAFLLALFVVNFVSAYETEINIKTVPGMEVQLTVLDSASESFSAIDRAVTLSDKNGDAQINYASEEFTFDLMVFVKDLSGETLSFSKKFREDFIAGETINIEVFPQGKSIGDYVVEEPVVNTTEENVTTNETSEDTEVDDSGLSGLVISDDGGLTNFTYVVGGVVMMALLAGGVVLARKTKFHLPKLKLPHFGGGGKSGGSSQSDRELIEDAEEKIKEAQEEIAKIRKEGKGELTEKEKKIIEAKKKLIADQKELQDLTG